MLEMPSVLVEIAPLFAMMLIMFYKIFASFVLMAPALVKIALALVLILVPYS